MAQKRSLARPLGSRRHLRSGGIASATSSTSTKPLMNGESPRAKKPGEGSVSKSESSPVVGNDTPGDPTLGGHAGREEDRRRPPDPRREVGGRRGPARRCRSLERGRRCLAERAAAVTAPRRVVAVLGRLSEAALEGRPGSGSSARVQPLRFSSGRHRRRPSASTPRATTQSQPEVAPRTSGSPLAGARPSRISASWRRTSTSAAMPGSRCGPVDTEDGEPEAPASRGRTRAPPAAAPGTGRTGRARRDSARTESRRSARGATESTSGWAAQRAIAG